MNYLNEMPAENKVYNSFRLYRAVKVSHPQGIKMSIVIIIENPFRTKSKMGFQLAQ